MGIEDSRIVYLTQLTRPKGQLYLPEAGAKLIGRYSFVKFPPPQDLDKDVLTFGMGKFDDVQINELRIYPDGVVVSGRVDTDVLDRFLDDLQLWSQSELGLIQAITAKPEKHFESTILIKAENDLSAVIASRNDVTRLITERLQRESCLDAGFHLTGFIIDCDQFDLKTGRRKPSRFLIERRFGLPFAENVFFSQAPLRTRDHLQVLQELEHLA